MCESTSAGTARQSSPTIETNCANRREAQENHTDDVIPETHGDPADDITASVKGTDVIKPTQRRLTRQTFPTKSSRV